MGLYLRNTLSDETEPFEPRGDEVTLYYCGLTVSDPAHLGHARSWVHVDVLRRWLEYEGHHVRHVENFTDVNEKIVARVGEREAWTDEAAVAEHYIDRTLDDMRSLNLRRASVYPRVTKHIDEIIELTERLIEAGYAYESNGSVYFDVPAFEGYGQLIEPEVTEDEAEHPDKRHPADFALWKAGGVEPTDIEEHVNEQDLDLEAAVAGALTWSSPWGDGRPGWHIECSAMSMTHLGDTFDIHAAGRDIVFPHNENEIAQSEAATDKPYAKYWVHIELLKTDDEKMSSSLGNFFTVSEAVEEFGANVVRTFLLSVSHDNRQAFTEEAIDEAATRWDRLRRAFEVATDALDGSRASAKKADSSLRDTTASAREQAERAMADNLDTRGALVALDELASEVITHVDNRSEEWYDYQGLLAALDVFERIGEEVLGLEFGADAVDTRLEDVVGDMLELRDAKRAEGEYAVADEIRALLQRHSIEIEDTDTGPRARYLDR